MKPFLDLSSKKIFDAAYGSLSFPLAEQSYAWLWVWQDSLKDMEWDLINGNLCLFGTFEGTRYIWGPPLPGNELQATLKRCFELCHEYCQKNKLKEKPALSYLPEEFIGNYKKIPGYEITHQNQDYIYKREDILNLNGEKLRNKRNLKNYFMKNYAYKVEKFDHEKHAEICMALLERWKRNKEVLAPEYQLKMQYEYDAIKRAIMMAKQFSLHGVVVYVDDSIEAFTFAEKTNNHIVTDFFEKTNSKIKGLSVFIFSEFMKLFDTEYVNAGEDWDVEYLKTIKMSYHPCILKKSYMVTENLS